MVLITSSSITLLHKRHSVNEVSLMLSKGEEEEERNWRREKIEAKENSFFREELISL